MTSNETTLSVLGKRARFSSDSKTWFGGQLQAIGVNKNGDYVYTQLSRVAPFKYCEVV